MRWTVGERKALNTLLPFSELKIVDRNIDRGIPAGSFLGKRQWSKRKPNTNFLAFLQSEIARQKMFQLKSLVCFWVLEENRLLLFVFFSIFLIKPMLYHSLLSFSRTGLNSENFQDFDPREDSFSRFDPKYSRTRAACCYGGDVAT